MTASSRGAHVVVSLDRSADLDTVRESAKKVADLLAKRRPEQLTVEVRKEKRGDRLCLDYLRNSYGQNNVAPYAVRAKPGAPVATPLDWGELSNAGLHLQSYTPQNTFAASDTKRIPGQG
jgi:bifunctional non-homologous end joining protein LigD